MTARRGCREGGQHGVGAGGDLLLHGSFLYPAGVGQGGAWLEFLSTSESNAVILFQAAGGNKELVNYIPH